MNGVAFSGTNVQDPNTIGQGERHRKGEGFQIAISLETRFEKSKSFKFGIREK